MINIKYQEIIKEMNRHVRRKRIDASVSEWGFTRLVSTNHYYNELLNDILNKPGEYEYGLKMGKYVLYIGRVIIGDTGTHRVVCNHSFSEDIYIFTNNESLCNALEIYYEGGKSNNAINKWNELVVKINNIKKLTDAI